MTRHPHETLDEAIDRVASTLTLPIGGSVHRVALPDRPVMSRWQPVAAIGVAAAIVIAAAAGSLLRVGDSGTTRQSSGSPTLPVRVVPVEGLGMLMTAGVTPQAAAVTTRRAAAPQAQHDLAPGIRQIAALAPPTALALDTLDVASLAVVDVAIDALQLPSLEIGSEPPGSPKE